MSWDILKEEIYNKWKPYWFQVHPADIAEYSWNYLFTGGKQIRPKLFCELWQYLSPDSPIQTELAFAIECIHVASLILDDTPWMDNANERRGKTTLHRVFSSKKALLITYELIDIVRNIWIKNKPAHIQEDVWQNLLKNKLQRLTIGQLYDIEKTGTLIELASLKTGILFELVTETVALCLGLDNEFWKIWGNNLGILFQWMDDWQDRDEDIVQSNRNAFNESYDITLTNYEYLWHKIEVGISKDWFLRPFGIFMKEYFTNGIPISNVTEKITNLENISIPYPTELIIPETIKYNFEQKGIPEFLTGKDMLRKLFSLTNHFFILESIPINLWYIDETNWDKVNEITSLIKKIKDL